VAALGAAILIALQLAAGYWLYSYIVWFCPLVLLALFGSFPVGRADGTALVGEPRQPRPLAVTAS
jgi:hypothetical protein